jgi:putative peptidoglycan lipid II flippase
VTARGSLARAGLVVTGAFLAARILGWVRLVVIGATFGPTDRDIFVAAFRIPDAMFQLVAAGALSSALIPIVSGLFAGHDEARAWRIASTVANLMLAILLVLAVVVAVAAPLLVPVITPGFDVAGQARTVDLTRIMLLSPILLALGALATSLLNAKGRFAASALAPMTYNLAIIASALFLAPIMGVTGLVVGVVAGSACHLGVQLLPLRGVGFRYAPRLDLRDPDARAAILLMVPQAIGLGAGQLTFLVVTSLATTIGVGAVSAFYFAFSIFQIPIGVIGLPIGVVMLPSLSRDLARGDMASYVSLVSRALRLILWVMLPLAGLTIVLSREVITFLFRSARFDERDVTLTAGALLFLTLALTSESLIAILARAFYARRDTCTPVAAAVLAVVLNVSLAILLVGRFELAGISLAIAIGSWTEVAVLLVVLDRRVGAFRPRELAGSGIAALGCAVAASLVALAARTALQGMVGGDTSRVIILAELVVPAGLAGLAYLGLSRLLRIPELDTIVRLLSDAFGRPARAARP